MCRNFWNMHTNFSTVTVPGQQIEEKCVHPYGVKLSPNFLFRVSQATALQIWPQAIYVCDNHWLRMSVYLVTLCSFFISWNSGIYFTCSREAKTNDKEAYK